MKGFYLVLIAAVIVAGCTGNYVTSTEKDAVSDLNAAKASEVLFIGDGGTFALNAVPVLKKINGVNYDFYGYNGMVPGPLLKVAQGSSITVNFTNNIDLPTTIHWHGLRH